MSCLISASWNSYRTQLSLLMPILEYVIYNPNPQMSTAPAFTPILAIIIIAQLDTLPYTPRQTIKIYK